MKKLKVGLIAILAIVAATGSSFTAKENKSTLYYFANTMAKASPGNNDLFFKGTTDPGAGPCDPSSIICYVSSLTAQDANGHPTSTVTTVRLGIWNQ